MRKSVAQNLVTYAVAAAIIWYAARRVSWSQVVDASSHATFWLFVVASLGGFLCWFIGETILYSRLFSYFHGPTRSRELLPTMAAVYFLQIINSYVASGAYVLFLHARKRVPWITGVCTLLFQTYVDVMLLAILSLFAIAVVPTSPIRLGLVLCGRCAWRRLFHRHVLALLGRAAGFRHLAPMALRTAVDGEFPHGAAAALPRARLNQVPDFPGAGFALYGQFVSFHIRAPASAGAGIDAIDRGDRKFAIFTGGNRNDSARLHHRLRRVRRAKTICSRSPWP